MLDHGYSGEYLMTEDRNTDGMNRAAGMKIISDIPVSSHHNSESNRRYDENTSVAEKPVGGERSYPGTPHRLQPFLSSD